MGKILFKKEINFNIKGGIGNQLFQYSFSRYLQSFNNFKINFLFEQINNSKNVNKKISARSFELNNFLKNKLFYNQFQPTFYEKALSYRTEKLIAFLSKKKIILPVKLYNGYWQDIFFAKFIKKEDFVDSLFVKPKSLPEYYYVLHFRGGDFYHSANHIVLDEIYYKNALDKFNDLPIYAVTDDKNNLEKILFKINKQIKILDCNFLDAFSIIYSAKGGISSNSTFAWWPIYLSKNINWIFPNKWLKNIELKSSNLYIPGTMIS